MQLRPPGQWTRFEPLHDHACFAQAFIDPVGRTVAWPGEIELDPEALHDEARKHPVAA